MCVPIELPPVRRQLHVPVTTVLVTPFSRWFPVTGVTTIDLAMKLADVQGDAAFCPYIQYAPVRTDEPDGWTQVGSTWYTSSQKLDVSPTSSSNFWARIGIGAKLEGGTTPGYGDVTLHAAMVQEGAVIATREFNINKELNATEDAYLLLTDMLPSRGLSKVKAAFVIMRLSGTLTYQLVYRTASTDKLEPGAWQNISGASGTKNTANESFLISDQTVTPGTTDMWYQIALEYSGAVSLQLKSSVAAVAS